MKNHMQRLSTFRRIKVVSGAAAGMFCLIMSAPVSATTLSDIFQVAERINEPPVDVKLEPALHVSTATGVLNNLNVAVLRSVPASAVWPTRPR